MQVEGDEEDVVTYYQVQIPLSFKLIQKQAAESLGIHEAHTLRIYISRFKRPIVIPRMHWRICHESFAVMRRNSLLRGQKTNAASQYNEYLLSETTKQWRMYGNSSIYRMAGELRKKQ